MSFYWFPGTVVFPRTSDEDMKRYGWRSGPWDTEPDRIYFVDENTGYDCFIARNSEIGNLCGYVGIPKSHAYFGKDADAVGMPIVIHGGVSYADSSADDEVREIPVSPSEEVWWVGFGCNELRDAVPRYSSISPPTIMPTYKNINFVIRQIWALAVQLEEIK